LINDEVLKAGAAPDISAHLDDCEFDVDLTNVEALLEECLKRLNGGDYSKPAMSDSWLGPRLHASLRIPRRLAADPGVWIFLTLSVGFDYAIARFGEETKRTRFGGSRQENALARLWWTTELFRNGPDYSPAEAALRNQDLINTVLKMDIAHHRPSCQALVKTRRRDDPSKPMTGREANALGKSINCAATTLMLGDIAPQPASAVENVEAWLADADNFNIGNFFGALLPDGPDDEAVLDSEIEPLVELFSKLLSEAPVRNG
jgi:hypothetical protein